MKKGTVSITVIGILLVAALTACASEQPAASQTPGDDGVVSVQAEVETNLDQNDFALCLPCDIPSGAGLRHRGICHPGDPNKGLHNLQGKAYLCVLTEGRCRNNPAGGRQLPGSAIPANVQKQRRKRHVVSCRTVYT